MATTEPGKPRSWLRRLEAYWFGPVPAWPLAAFRILFALALIAYFTDRIYYLEEFLGDSAGRMPDLGLAADSPLRFHQPFYVGPLERPLQLAAAGVFYVLALCLLIGFRAQRAAGLLAGWVVSVTLVDWMGAFSFNRSAVLILSMMAAMPLTAVWSVDARLRAGPGPADQGLPAWRTGRISAWSVRTLQWFLLLWYVMAGMVKLRGDWSLLTVNDVLWSQLQGWYQNDLCWWALNHVPKAVFGAGEHITLYFELLAPLCVGTSARIPPTRCRISRWFQIAYRTLRFALAIISCVCAAYSRLAASISASWICVSRVARRSGSASIFRRSASALARVLYLSCWYRCSPARLSNIPAFASRASR